jgi:hypothetical protein
VVELVFGVDGLPDQQILMANRLEERKSFPAWWSYLKGTKSPIWQRFTEKEQISARHALHRYFSELLESSCDLNQIFFRAYEQQGSNFLTSLLPEYKRRLGAASWSAVIAALGSLFPKRAADVGYDRKRSGQLTGSFFKSLRRRPEGKALINTLRATAPGKRSGWQLLWRMMRGCAALEKWNFDFGRALNETGVIEYLEGTDELDGEAAVRNWKLRYDLFSEFVTGIPGVGWNTFDYVLRDLHYRGCLLLFKLDSTNEEFIRVVFGVVLSGNRTRYLELLADSGTLDKYPPAVVNMAIYAFSSHYYLGYLSKLRKIGDNNLIFEIG